MKYFYLLILTSLFFLSCYSEDSPKETNNSTMEEQEVPQTTVRYTGDFVSAAHPTMGMVSIDEDETTLQIKNFKTDSGPLLEMYLSTSTSANSYISLGELKGLDGDYEYALPENIDLDTYNYVMVWCVDFSVNFGHAILSKN